MPKTQIARTLGMSRTTVDRLAQLEEPPRFKQIATLTAHKNEVLRKFAAHSSKLHMR